MIRFRKQFGKQIKKYPSISQFSSLDLLQNQSAKIIKKTQLDSFNCRTFHILFVQIDYRSTIYHKLLYQMVNPSETKNLVIIYQKLFNSALKRYKSKSPENKLEAQKINIRSCSGVGSFKHLMLDYPELRETMINMFDSGELLETLVKWRGIYSNMAIALKYFNKLQSIVRNPDKKGKNWSDDQESFKKVELQGEMQKNTNRSMTTIDEQVFSDSVMVKEKSSVSNGLRCIYDMNCPMQLNSFDDEIFFGQYPEVIPIKGFGNTAFSIKLLSYSSCKSGNFQKTCVEPELIIL